MARRTKEAYSSFSTGGGAQRGAPAAQVALVWLLHRPGVTAPIAGATKLSHLEDSLAAEELELSEDEMRQLEEPYIPHGVSGYRRGNGGRPDPGRPLLPAPLVPAPPCYSRR